MALKSEMRIQMPMLSHFDFIGIKVKRILKILLSRQLNIKMFMMIQCCSTTLQLKNMSDTDKR